MRNLRNIVLMGMLMIGTAGAWAQADPVLMRINGQPVTRSEFEYSYNKNNTEGVIDKKTVEEYVELFINYKLKVLAALDAKMDTLTSYQQEFAQYRDQQIRPAMITDADVEAEAYKIYSDTRDRVDANGGLINPSHILILVPQQASNEVLGAARERIDSIYQALTEGADFADMACRLSQDPGSARKGGNLSWIQKGRLLKEFEEAAFALQPGEMSKPVQTTAGFHIIKMNGRQSFFPYDTVRTDILQFIETRGIRENIINNKLDSLAKAAQPQTTPEKVLEQKRLEMEAHDMKLHYLIQEYHDGLLLYEISNQTVWEKAAKDEAGLTKYFKQNKKKYVWDAPRFKGIAYYARQEEDINNVKTALKKVPFNQWAEVLRTTFNNDSVLRIRAEKGIFRKGDNALVDREVFKCDTTVRANKNFPYTATYGKMQKAPLELDDVRSLVVADYQDMLEKQWMEALRKRYPVEVDPKVLATVNKHN